MLTERLAAETRFHDEQAELRAVTFDREPARLPFDDSAYLDHEPWIRPAFAQLGTLSGLDALDLGCGHGMAAIVMARQGARVVASDLSAGYLREAERRAFANGVSLTTVQTAGERLPFADGSFDRIWGSAILHHLDLQLALPEVRRVLRPGGVAVFCEPWGGNPLVEFARRRVPYPGKERTRDEKPLTRADLQAVQAHFASAQWQGYQLLGMAGRVVRWPTLTRALNWCDARLLAWMPWLARWGRYVVVTVRRE